MNEALNQLLEGLASVGGEDARIRGAVLVGTGLVALSSLIFRRRRKPDRIIISANIPAGQNVRISTGDKD